MIKQVFVMGQGMGMVRVVMADCGSDWSNNMVSACRYVACDTVSCIYFARYGTWIWFIG